MCSQTGLTGRNVPAFSVACHVFGVRVWQAVSRSSVADQEEDEDDERNLALAVAMSLETCRTVCVFLALGILLKLAIALHCKCASFRTRRISGT